MFPVIVIILFVFLLGVALAVTMMEDLFAAAMLTGISSLLAAGLFTLMDAVDVAFTEAAVGAGISTVLILATLGQTEKMERQRKGIRWRALFVVFLTGGVLLYGTLDMPHYGDPKAPIHNHVSNRYIEGSKPKVDHESGHGTPSHSSGDSEYRGEVDVPNIVTSVLADYRSYDTFGETTVILTAGLGIMLLMLCRHEKRGKKP